MMKRYVLIVAGGRGLRMGSDLPKQFIPMEGKPVLMHTLEAFHRWDASAGLILVLPEDHQPYWKMLCREIGCKVPHRIITTTSKQSAWRYTRSNAAITDSSVRSPCIRAGNSFG